MIWSLLKVLIFIALVAAATFGANALMLSNDGIRLVFAGYEFTPLPPWP